MGLCRHTLISGQIQMARLRERMRKKLYLWKVKKGVCRDLKCMWVKWKERDKRCMLCVKYNYEHEYNIIKRIEKPYDRDVRSIIFIYVMHTWNEMNNNNLSSWLGMCIQKKYRLTWCNPERSGFFVLKTNHMGGSQPDHWPWLSPRSFKIGIATPPIIIGYEVCLEARKLIIYCMFLLAALPTPQDSVKFIFFYFLITVNRGWCMRSGTNFFFVTFTCNSVLLSNN